MYQVPDVHLLTFLPFVAVVLTGLVTMVLSAFGTEEQQARLPRIGLLGLAVSGIALLLAGTARTNSSFGGMLNMDGTAVWFHIVFLITTALTVALAADHFKDLGAEHREIYALLLFACMGMMLMAAAGNLVVLFIGLETMSVALYIMAAMGGRRQESSNEAALKYLLLGAFATGFLVYGMALLYGATGSLAFATISDTVAAGSAHVGYLAIGLALLTIGLGFKVALVPFHMWAPDVYEGSPTVVTAFMAVGPKLAGFAAMWRILHDAALPAQQQWMPVLAVLAVVTMLVGNLAALTQTNIKRLLAYSSIAHAGYIALGVMAGNQTGLQGVLYYAATYAFLSLAAFTVVLIANGDTNEQLHIDELRGLGKRAPLAAASLTVALVGMAGIPPLSGFLGKYLLFSAAVQSGHVAVAAIGVLCSVISVYYYFRLIVLMYMQPPVEGAQQIEITGYTKCALVATLVGTIILSLPIGWPIVLMAGWCAV